MTVANIPFTARVNKNVDEMETSANGVEMTDCYMDELGYVNRRPGLEVFSTVTGAGRIDGIYYWDELLVTIVVSAGTVYSINASATPTTIGSGLLADGVVTFTPAKIAGADVLAMANGNGVFTTDGTTLTAQTQSPNDATHVAFIDRYLLANDTDTGLFKWSDLNDPTAWNALNFAEAERKPDNVLAVHVQGRDIVIFGYRSIEFYYDDGSSPFRRFEGGEVETGVSVAHSIQYIPEIASWLYLDENRHLIRLTNRQPTKVSGPYDDEIQDLTNVTDGVSSVSRVGGRGWYIISFPSENITFVYDYQQDAWYKWGNWNSKTASYDRFLGNVMTYDTRNNRFLVGDKNAGLIYSMKNSVFQDNGAEIRSNVRTGFIGHGTQNKKKSRKVQFRMKRGVAKDASDTAGEVNVRFRDDYTGTFSNELKIGTGIGGDSRFNTEIYVGGIYRSRQWDIVSSDNTPFIIGGFQEDIEVLRN
jgi:hypothetical protein